MSTFRTALVMVWSITDRHKFGHKFGHKFRINGSIQVNSKNEFTDSRLDEVCWWAGI
ncbi:MAG TPA: hypothetical protein VH481_04495 [Nitrososphaeraceae archaeon]